MKHANLTDSERAKRVAEAKKRYGKDFAHERKVARCTEPSFVLREIERRSGVKRFSPVERNIFIFRRSGR